MNDSRGSARGAPPRHFEPRGLGGGGALFGPSVSPFDSGGRVPGGRLPEARGGRSACRPCGECLPFWRHVAGEGIAFLRPHDLASPPLLARGGAHRGGPPRGEDRFKSYFYGGQDSFNYCFGDSGGPTFLGLIGQRGAIVRVASAFTGDQGTDVGADPVSFRPQLLALASALETTGISYRAQVQNIGFQSAVSNGAVSGTIGQSRRLEALQVWSATPGVVPCYSAYVEGSGWGNELCDGTLVGTVGQSRRVEAVQINLVQKGPYSHVQYRAHVQDVGWQPFVTDGQTCSSHAQCPTNLCVRGTCAAGTTGQGRRLEALQISVF